MLISEFELVKKFCAYRGIDFTFKFCGSKYAAYRLKSAGENVVRLDNDYFVISNTLHLMIRRYLIALRKGDGSSETLFCL